MDSILSSFDDVIQALKQSSSKEECLRKAYEILAEKYEGNRLKTITRFWELFYTTDMYWNRTGFLHCTSFNRLLARMLIESGHFTKKEIKSKWTQIWIFSPHQYLKVHTGNKWVDIDLWGHNFGIEFGDHAHTFHEHA